MFCPARCNPGGYARPHNPAVQRFAAGFSSLQGGHFSNIYAPQGKECVQPRNGTSEFRNTEMKTMKTRMIAMTSLCAMLILALALPALADDSAQPLVQPSASIAPADTSGFDPVGPVLGFLGLRHDIHSLQGEDRNLSQDVNANRQEIHQNWWDNLGIFNNILGNRETVRSDQQADLADRQANLGLRQDIRNEQIDIKDNPDNKTADLQQIAGDRGTIRGNWQEINTTHSEIHDERNLSRGDWADIHANNQADGTLRQENNATRGEIRANHEQIQDDREQIRDGRKNGSSEAGSS